MKRTEAIQKFLHSQSYPMAKLYTPDMEVQLNVSKGKGDLIEGEYRGKRWVGYTDGLQTWKSFRIPWNASSTPEYEDSIIRFDISQHTEAIGMTGWDWKNKKSLWVGYDFDSLIDHERGLNEGTIRTIRSKISSLSYCTTYSSSGGNGFHIYIFLEVQNIQNHNVHTALAKAILNKISQEINYRLETQVDAVGGNLWVYHQKATNKSYQLIKQGGTLIDIPSNWREYIPKRRTLIQHHQTNVEELAASKRLVNLNEEQVTLLKWFEKSQGLWWWDEQKQMLVCHTYDLKLAHKDLGLKGFYDTISEGKDHGRDQNCFAFPTRDGGWILRRHTKAVKEHGSWFLSETGWTTTYYNRIPNIRTAITINGGVEGEKEYYFQEIKNALTAIELMGCDISGIPEISPRSATIKDLYDGRILLTFPAYETGLEGFVNKNKNWQKVFFRPTSSDDTELPDHLIRHVVQGDNDADWFVATNIGWVKQQRNNVVSFLINNGYKRGQVDRLLGEAIYQNWSIVCKPFQPEYPGNREWNRIAPQFKYNAERGKFETWKAIFKHCGNGLNTICKQNEWCREHGIQNGSTYLQLWFASCLQYPGEPLPYIFLFGPQNSGKSILHEAFSILFTRGVTRADQALNNQQGFNGELIEAIICVIEETHLGKKGPASDRIKDWVTSKILPIHKKGYTPFEIKNYTHWIQCANDSSYCPILPGDTRITLIRVEPPHTEIPKEELLERCRAEAPAILWHLLNFRIPSTKSRLRIPVLETAEKRLEIERNTDALSEFISDYIYEIPGQKIMLSEFYRRFQEWLDPTERPNWTMRRVGKNAPFVRGKYGGDNKTYLGNCSFEKLSVGKTFNVSNGRLIQ